MILTLLRGLLLALITIPMSLVVIVSLLLPGGDRMFHGYARAWCGVVLWLFGIKVSLRFVGKLQHGQQYVYVCNHASMFDIPAVITSIPDNIHIVLKEELTKVPFWGWVMKLSPYIKINRSNPREAKESLDKAATYIKSGKSVLLFGEGTRTRDGKLQPFKRGAFSIAVHAGTPVVPVTINNTFRILPKGEWRVQPTDIELILDSPIPVDAATDRDAEMRLMQATHQAIEQHYVDQG